MAEEEGMDRIGEMSPPEGSIVTEARARPSAPAAAALASDRSTFCSEIVMASDARKRTVPMSSSIAGSIV